MDNTNNLLPQKIRQIQLLLADKAIGKVGSVTTSFDPRDGIMFTCQHVTSSLNIAAHQKTYPYSNYNIPNQRKYCFQNKSQTLKDHPEE